MIYGQDYTSCCGAAPMDTFTITVTDSSGTTHNFSFTPSRGQSLELSPGNYEVTEQDPIFPPGSLCNNVGTTCFFVSLFEGPGCSKDGTGTLAPGGNLECDILNIMDVD